MTVKLNIAIAGAGVGGLASAILLTRLGHKVTVFETFKVAKPIGSGLMMQPTGLAALDVLGLRDALVQKGAKLTRLHGTTTKGATTKSTVIFDVAYEDLSPGLHAIGIHRAALHQILWDSFVQCGADFEGGTAIAAATMSSADSVSLTSEKGAHVGQFDLLIDATGARSKLRAVVDPRPAKKFDYGAVWASVPATQVNPEALTQRYVRASTMIGHLPIGKLDDDGPSLAAFFWSLKGQDYPMWRTQFEAWRQQVVELWPQMEPIVERLTSPDDLIPADYYHFTAKTPYAGRIALIGDSAHSTSPQLGQGANNALLDACALAAGLAQAQSVDEGLATYAQTRKPHVRFYQLASALMTPIFQGDSHILPWGRDLVFNRLKIVPWLRHEMVRTLSGLKTGPFSSSSPSQLASAAPLEGLLTYGAGRYQLPG